MSADVSGGFVETLLVIDPCLSDVLAVKYQGKELPHARMMPPPVPPDVLRDVDAVFCTHRHGIIWTQGRSPCLPGWQRSFGSAAWYVAEVPLCLCVHERVIHAGLDHGEPVEVGVRRRQLGHRGQRGRQPVRDDAPGHRLAAASTLCAE